jgi:hypothetical protein
VLLVALAVLSLQLVRAEHIHPAGIEGRIHSLVHSHLPGSATAGGERAYAAHGDHRLAIFLAAVYESVLRHTSPCAPDSPVFLHSTFDGTPHFHRIGVVWPGANLHPPGRIACASQDARRR